MSPFGGRKQNSPVSLSATRQRDGSEPASAFLTMPDPFAFLCLAMIETYVSKEENA